MATKKRKPGIYIPLIIVIALVITGGIYWYLDYMKYIKTDDAIVTSDMATVSPKIAGRIVKLYAAEGDSVKQGQLLAELDSTDLLSQKRQLIANKMQTEAARVQAVAKYDYDNKNIEVLKIGSERASEDYERAKTQFSGGVATKEQYDHLKKALETAEAQYAAAQAQVQVSKTQVASADAAIGTSQAQIDVINTQLHNTRIYSPGDGVVARRWLLPGDMVSAGQSIFSVNNNSKFWLLIYLEETKIARVHLGQAVHFTIDTYPDRHFTGKVFYIGSTTASQFSLIPASNASGNFTKVTQRIPIKISIDGVDNDGNLQQFRFATGMSAVVKIVK